jgi:hypothetical protein
MSDDINNNVIQIDFSKVNRAVAEYLREEIKKKAINSDGLHALLLAFQGIQIPDKLAIITNKADVNFEEIKARLHEHNKDLWVAIARLEVWFSIKRIKGQEVGNEEEIIKNKAATILAHCL